MASASEKLSLSKACKRKLYFPVGGKFYTFLKLISYPVFKTKLAFKFILNLSLHRLLSGHTLLALPSFIANIHFSKRLKITIPLDLLDKELCDWITVNSKIIHIHENFIICGDITPVTKTPSFIKLSKDIRNLADSNWAYKKTARYTSIKKEILLDNPPTINQQIIDSEDKILSYFNKVKKLYQSIAIRGLLHIDELDNKFKKPFPIYVGIDSKGEFFKLPSGKHRLAIAKALNIKNVPVVINMIHHDWIKHIAFEKQVSDYEAICIILNDCKSNEKYQ